MTYGYTGTSRDDDIIMFEVPPPLLSRGLARYQETWDLFLACHDPGQRFGRFEEVEPKSQLLRLLGAKPAPSLPIGSFSDSLSYVDLALHERYYERITIAGRTMVLHPVAQGRFSSRRRKGVGLRYARVTLCVFATLLFASTSAPHSEEFNTITMVYSEEQAHKGHDLYNEHCASCHGAALEGQGSLPLNGATFRARWADDRHSVDDLFYIIRTLMPYGQPATLSKQQYVDITAYILMVNGYPVGAVPLSPDPRILKRIIIRPPQP